MKVLVCFVSLVIFQVLAQNLATFYAIDGIVSDRSVNRIVKKLSLPHELKGVSKYNMFTHINLKHILLADIFVSKPGLVGKYNDQFKNQFHLKGDVITCKIVFSWNKKLNLFPFFAYKKGTGVLLLKSKDFDLNTNYSKTTEGKFLEISHLHIEFDKPQTEFLTTHAFTEHNQEGIKNELFDALTSTQIANEIQDLVEKQSNQYLKILGQVQAQSEKPVYRYSFDFTTPVNLHLDVVNLYADQTGLYVFRDGGFDKKSHNLPTQTKQFPIGQNRGNVQYAINKDFFENALEVIQSKKLIEIILDSKSHHLNNLNFKIVDLFFLEKAFQQYTPTTPYKVDCSIKDDKSQTKIVLNTETQQIDVNVPIVCKFIVEKEDKQFEFLKISTETQFNLVPAYSEDKVDFQLHKINILKINSIDGIDQSVSTYEQIAKKFNQLIEIQQHVLVWGSKLPSPQMSYVGYTIVKDWVVIYGNGIRK